MKRIMNPKALVVLLALGGLIVSFQNCSRVDFQAMEGGSLKGNGDADQITLIDDVLVNDESTPQDDSSVVTPDLTNDDSTTTVADDDTNPPPPPPSGDDDTTTVTEDDNNPPPPPPMGDDDTTVADDDTTPPPTASPTPISDELKEALAECASRLKKGAIPVSAGSTIANLSGAKAFSSTSFNEAKSLSGKTDLLRTGDTMGTINGVKNVSGTTLICGFNVTKIENISGNLTVVGGHIGSISSKSGTVKLIGGTVGDISNSSGNFKFEQIP